MKDKIEVGDVVTIQVTERSWLRGEVLYIPQASGDSWHIAEEYTAITADDTSYIKTFSSRPKRLHYVQQFLMMSLDG